MLKYNFTQNNVCYILNRNVKLVNKDSYLYEDIKEAILNGDEFTLAKLNFDSLSEVAEYIYQWSKGNISVVDEKFQIWNKPVHHTFESKIIHFFKLGLPALPLVEFIGKINDCINKSNVEIFKVLSDCHHPITTEGNLIAYKAVTNDYKDCYTESISNRIGNIVSMDRDYVYDDETVHCAHGLHVGNFDCAFGYLRDDNRLMVIEVDPKDIICVPKNYFKMRVCKYKVISEIIKDKFFDALKEELVIVKSSTVGKNVVKYSELEHLKFIRSIELKDTYLVSVNV